MEEFDIIHNENIEKPYRGLYPKVIYINCYINSSPIATYSNLEECIFINCRISNVKIKNIEEPIEMSFLNCSINNLEIGQSLVPNLQFIGCILENSVFKNSNLPGFTFSRNTTRDIEVIIQNLILGKNRLEKKFISLKNLQILDSSIFRSKFICCYMNDMQLDNTIISDTEIKHCYLEYMEVLENVLMKGIDIRGTKFSKSSFGKCQFKGVRFNKGYFFIEWLDYFITFTPKIILKLLYKRPAKIGPLQKKRRMDRIIKANIIKYRTTIKRVLYKLKLSFFADILSSTDFKQTQYKEADFTEDYHLYWHIQYLDFISNFKKKHPVFAFLTFWASNFMRSFMALFILSLMVILLFSEVYKIYGDFQIDSEYQEQEKITIIDQDGHPQKAFHLSVSIFLNSSYCQVEPRDTLTKFISTIEIIIGYFSLGILLSIILFSFARRTSLPNNNIKKETFPSKIKRKMGLRGAGTVPGK